MRAGALGDVLLLRRTVASLRRGGHEVTLLAPASSGAALVGSGPSEVTRLLNWERADVAALVAGEAVPPDSLRRGLAGHDLALAFTRSDTLVPGLRRFVPQVLARDPNPPAGAAAARWFADLVRSIGLDPEADPPLCTPSPAESESAARWRARLPARFLAMHPGSGSPRKNWPAERFREMARRLRPDERWLVALGPADEAVAGVFRSESDCVVAEGLSHRALGALLAHAGVFVGNDSGVSHLAAAWGAPTVALFGPTDARVWAPDAERVRTLQSPTGEMAGIDVEEALLAAAAMARMSP